jgi:UPF0176 protein
MAGSLQPRDDRSTRMPMNPSTPKIRVAALYRFCRIDAPEALRKPLAAFCCGRGIKGTLLIACEGINGTVAGSPEAIAELIARLEAIPGMAGLEVKFSAASAMPFHRMKVRLKKEIVTLKDDITDPTQRVGMYVDPENWNALLDTPDIVLLDTRNQFEVEMGTFDGAIDPQLKSFSEFRDYVDRALDPQRDTKIAMFCTGGIRCEKASSYLLSRGFKDVFHLKGGILKYLETVPQDQSRWHGECFVFDQRVALGHGLTESATAKVSLQGDEDE